MELERKSSSSSLVFMTHEEFSETFDKPKCSFGRSIDGVPTFQEPTTHLTAAVGACSDSLASSFTSDW